MPVLRSGRYFGRAMLCHSPPASPRRTEFASSSFLTPTKPGKLAAKQEPIATAGVGANAHDGFFVRSGSGIAGSQVLAESEARGLCGIVEEAGCGSGAGSSLESASESMTWSVTGMIMGLGL